MNALSFLRTTQPLNHWPIHNAAAKVRTSALGQRLQLRGPEYRRLHTTRTSPLSPRQITAKRMASSSHREEGEEEDEVQPLLSKPNSTTITTTTKTIPEPRETNTLPLPSRPGSTLSYAIYGSPDPSSPTILYLHGYPSSRLEASLLHRLALQHTPPIRIISPDRPGFGLSTAIPGRAIASYASDHLIHFVNAPSLQIGRFSVLGLSGGGPYALACTLHPGLRSDKRLAAVGVAAGAPYWSEQAESGWRMLPWWSKVGYYAAWYAPLPSRVVTEGVVGVVRWLVGTRWLQRRLEKVLLAGKERREKGIDAESGQEGDAAHAEAEADGTDDTAQADPKREVDRAARIALGEDDPCWTPTQQRESLVAQLLEPFRQGAAECVNELKLYSVNWGFSLSDIDWDNKDDDGRRVILWHGTQDVNAPIAGARYMARAIKGAELREYNGTHGEVLCKFEEILEELAKPLLVDGGGVGPGNAGGR